MGLIHLFPDKAAVALRNTTTQKKVYPFPAVPNTEKVSAMVTTELMMTQHDKDEQFLQTQH